MVQKHQITNLKTMISLLLTRPQGWQGCQKIRKTKLKTTLVTWSTKIQPKLNKIQKTFRKQGFFDNFCSILTVFHSFFNFGWILALQLTRVDFSLVVRIFWHPWHPCGRTTKPWLKSAQELPVCNRKSCKTLFSKRMHFRDLKLDLTPFCPVV